MSRDPLRPLGPDRLSRRLDVGRGARIRERGQASRVIVTKVSGVPGRIGLRDSPAQREETLRNSLKARISTAELSDIKVENVTDPIKPFLYAYHVRVPGYAQRTGKRIFLQPAFFEHGVSTLFSSSERRYPIYFHYPWSEEDEVTIDLPAGYVLDHADAPNSIKIGQIGEYSPTIAASSSGKSPSATSKS